MESFLKKLLSLTFMVLLFGNVLAKAADHDHHTEKNHTKKSLTLNNGKKWVIDQTMRENMDAIRLQLNTVKQLINSKKVTQKDYNGLSDLLTKSSQEIASKCKLEPAADETFHVVLADLITVSEDLKAPKKAKHAVEKLTHALKIYSQYFDHADFL